jgi:bifunctional pyridoxal-dependent enzyme with beta-cystathionase and maltose regulon repressor activities
MELAGIRTEDAGLIDTIFNTEIHHNVPWVKLSAGMEFGGTDCELFQRINIGCAQVTLEEGHRRIAVQPIMTHE